MKKKQQQKKNWKFGVSQQIIGTSCNFRKKKSIFEYIGHTSLDHHAFKTIFYVFIETLFVLTEMQPTGKYNCTNNAEDLQLKILLVAAIVITTFIIMKLILSQTEFAKIQQHRSLN